MSAATDPQPVTATRRHVPTAAEKAAAVRELTVAIGFPTDAQVDADLRAAFAAQARAERTAPTFDELAAAIDRLGQSERGRAVLRRFVSMLKEYGFGLDTGNWQALATLHRAGAAGQQHRILDILATASRPGRAGSTRYPEGEE